MSIRCYCTSSNCNTGEIQNWGLLLHNFMVPLTVHCCNWGLVIPWIFCITSGTNQKKKKKRFININKTRQNNWTHFINTWDLCLDSKFAHGVQSFFSLLLFSPQRLLMLVQSAPESPGLLWPQIQRLVLLTLLRQGILITIKYKPKHQIRPLQSSITLHLKYKVPVFSRLPPPLF